jgi:hypothetical protein
MSMKQTSSSPDEHHQPLAAPAVLVFTLAHPSTLILTQIPGGSVQSSKLSHFRKLTSCHDEQSDDFWCCFLALHSQLLVEILWVTIYINKICLEQFIHTTEVFGVLFGPYRLPLHMEHAWYAPCFVMKACAKVSVSLFVPAISIRTPRRHAWEICARIGRDRTDTGL